MVQSLETTYRVIGGTMYSETASDGLYTITLI